MSRRIMEEYLCALKKRIKDAEEASDYSTDAVIDFAFDIVEISKAGIEAQKMLIASRKVILRYRMGEYDASQCPRLTALMESILGEDEEQEKDK
jgi:hypothetical protein